MSNLLSTNEPRHGPEAYRRMDTRGRLLFPGEDQMPDGRYRYRYQDWDGTRRAAYSWRLVPGDALPENKRDGMSLREKERLISENLQYSTGRQRTGRQTLDQWFRFWLEGKPMLKPTTRTNYAGIYDCYIACNLGNRRLEDIRYSDIRTFYNKLLYDGVRIRVKRTGKIVRNTGISMGSLKLIHSILRPIFSLAVRDGCIRTNPCDHALADVQRSSRKERGRRHALTEEQQQRFVNFVSSSERYREWLPILTVFLGTGCRVGELIGLRWEDCDFEQNLISVNHSIIYGKFGNSACAMQVSTPKSESGHRTVPMLQEVRAALLKEYAKQQALGSSLQQPVIDGYTNFVFVNRNGNLFNPSCINRMLERMRKSCNLEEQEKAQKESRSPVEIPHFSAHNLRHTFCTRFCENETNLKTIQEIMGHSDIQITMNVYAEATEAKKQQSMQKLEGKIKIS